LFFNSGSAGKAYDGGNNRALQNQQQLKFFSTTTSEFLPPAWSPLHRICALRLGFMITGKCDLFMQKM
jgi:hypothetical protein